METSVSGRIARLTELLEQRRDRLEWQLTIVKEQLRTVNTPYTAEHIEQIVDLALAVERGGESALDITPTEGDHGTQ